MKFIHLSDRHWRSDQINNALNLRLQAWLDINCRDTHYLLETGDITDDGHQAQYENVAHAMSGWRDRWYFVPGNHDYGRAGLFYEQERADRFHDMLAGPFMKGADFDKTSAPEVVTLVDETDTVTLIMLSSCIETLDPFDFACGEICQTQIDNLCEVLDDSPPDATRIVMMHHHPWMHGDWMNELIDSRKLLRVLHHKVDILLFGHRHVAGFYHNRADIPIAIAGPASFNVPWITEITVENRTISTKKCFVGAGLAPPSSEAS